MEKSVIIDVDAIEAIKSKYAKLSEEEPMLKSIYNIQCQQEIAQVIGRSSTDPNGEGLPAAGGALSGKRFCGACGAPASPEAKFCGNCGTRL